MSKIFFFGVMSEKPLGPKWEEKNFIYKPGTPVQPSFFMVGNQLDDSQSLHKEMLFHQTSIKTWLFRVPVVPHKAVAEVSK